MISYSAFTQMGQVDTSHLRRRFVSRFPGVLISKIRWKLDDWKKHYLSLLNRLKARLTVIDGFGALGDTLITGIVINNIKRHYPSLRINCITPNPTLLENDPMIETFNHPETYFSLVSWYVDLRNNKDGSTNIIVPTLAELGIKEFEYRSKVYLSEEERESAAERLDGIEKPIISINTSSREQVKNWPVQHWQNLVYRFSGKYSIIQLGTDSEPTLSGVTLRLAGKTSPRESLAILSHCSLHVGPDSFLVHGANGVGVPSVVIFGGARSPGNLGYQENRNIHTSPHCSPCWIHEGDGEVCQYGISCLHEITVDQVADEIYLMLASIESRN